ncbi:SIR2 family NAD-dependent protein deacylase [Micromonospora endolithica]|uniref:NAD-dependent protein deacylase n=1 Tax=Micromonospora endolithica TaxID=230091 RepID=A0A3A9YU68_9ACTN|nr:NAD-dependent protein deacylase [Micromonospora endolithica]RKN39612.1 NAD-dependent protein deacylase [Micromonospora endolithica]TWJ22251.1 NAD-dependent deacetylase [Micromonospora endolithica]
MSADAVGRAADLLRRARRVVVFTGAGMSAESGVPTFRDALTGLWQRYDAQTLATPAAFHADPDLVWGWYEWRRAAVRRARPNPGHLAVATIEARVPDSVVITQNVDDLHERAGSPAPLHLHGSLFAPRCASCARSAPEPDGPPEEPADGRRTPPPRCAGCGAAVRPGVVWFGEALPGQALEAAVEAAASCDLLLTVGTSGLVYPAAEIPQVASRFGAVVVQVNPRETPLDAVAEVNLRGPAARLLPALVDATWDGTGPQPAD